MLDTIKGLTAIPLLFVYGLLAIPLFILEDIINFLIGDIEDE